MDPDEEKLKKYLEERGFTCERFSKEETRTGKTPDFRVFRGGDFVFFCEVKSSPKDRWLDKLLEGATPGEIVGGGRSDPIFNRLTADIHSAVKQFNAVNPDQKWPSVLALVNHDDMCGFNDLIGILTGNFYADDGNTHPIYKQFSEGRIRDEKGKIHLFIWLDDFKPQRLLFSQTNHECHIRLCELLGTNSNDIKQIRF
jgi:hypothetical protein